MSKRNFQDFLGNVDEIAAYWVVRLGSEDCTPEERFAFDAWKREDPAHEAAYLKIKKGNDYLDRHMSAPDFQARIEQARQRTRPSIWRRAPTGWAAAAAAFVAVLAGVYAVSDQRVAPENPNLVIAQQVEAYETTVGERSTVTLPDGSVVTINTNSRVEVDYSSALREIRLTRGQGFFDVAKDLNRPFVVVAGDKRVMALGTVFDVRFDDANEVQVTLVEGRVKVEELAPITESTSAEVPERVVLATKTIEMNPGERLISKLNEQPTLIKTDTIEETSWRKGQLVFRNRPLADVVEEMNRYSAQQLILDVDDRVLALEVSGVFNNGGPPAAFVDALEAMHPLQAERTSENQLTLVWRE